MIGATEDAVRSSTLTDAKAQMDLLALAGFRGVRITQIWAPGLHTLSPADKKVLDNVVAAAQLSDVTVLTSVMNKGSATTPLTPGDQADFAAYAASIVQEVPSLRTLIIGNEPNLNRYWLPQFGPNGEDVAATAYTQLLARTYDAMKAADSKVFIIGGSLAPRGVDRPGTGRDTHSPTAFIRDMGTAYRALKRNRPIMDGFSFHPYGENSSTPPTFEHLSGTSLGLADYDTLVALLGTAFDGTKQLGSALPIVYDEYGVDSQIPDAKRRFYGGREPATTKPVTEGVQAAYYREALDMAACQPTVRGFLIFHVTDETDHNRWQSGVYYADGTPKSTRPFVKQAMAQIRAGAIECQAPPPIGKDTGGWALATGADVTAVEQGSIAVGNWTLVQASSG